MSNTPLRIGLFGIGLDTYWPQFEGLKARLEGYLATVAGKLACPGVELVNVGLVDNPERAYEAGRELRRAKVPVVCGLIAPPVGDSRWCREQHCFWTVGRDGAVVARS